MRERPANSPILPQIMHNLANSLSTRYLKYGNPDDLSSAIEWYRRSVALRQPDSDEMPRQGRAERKTNRPQKHRWQRASHAQLLGWSLT